MSELLKVSDLRVRYPVDGSVASMFKRQRRSFVDVVHGVSLSLERGETLAIVGESGSGKTTLAMALCGLAPVHGGEVSFDGDVLLKDRNQYLQSDRRRVALMFQDPVGSLSPRMNVRKLLGEPFRIHPDLAGDPDRCQLWLHDGERYRDASTEWHAGIAGPVYGVACGDHDSDGDVDVGWGCSYSCCLTFAVGCSFDYPSTLSQISVQEFS